MTALALVLLVVVGVLNIANHIRVEKNAEDLLRILSDNGGSFPVDERFIVPMAPPPGFPGGDRGVFEDNGLFGFHRTPETPYETRWFWVRLSEEGEPMASDLSHIASIDEEQAVTMAAEVLQRGKTGGRIGDYRYRLDRIDKDGSMMAVFLDNTSEEHTERLILVASLLISGVVLLFTFLLVFLLSTRAVKPTVTAFEKQKRFISDASHELKTPLTVISADVDVMELSGEKSEWTASIRDQVSRMNDLIRDMLTLSRMEDDSVRRVFSDVDLSALASQETEPFRVVARSQDKTYETVIDEGIHVQGDAAALSHLFSILSDNALKYSGKDAQIRVELKRTQKCARLEFFNTCETLPEGDLGRLFDRFYRADTSRNRESGGFGIGLSVARAIAESHGGKISVRRDGDHGIRFITEIPF